MKILWVLAAILAVVTAAAVGEGESDKLIGDATLAKVRKWMREGNPALGIPVVAPFQKDLYEMNLALGNFVDFQAELTNIYIDGLDRFVANSISFNIFKMKVTYDITIPDLSATGRYDTIGRLYRLIPLFGVGNFKIDPKNIRLTGHVNLNRFSGFLRPKDFYVEVQLEALDTNIEGMVLGGELSDLLNLVIQDLVPTVIKNFQPQISKAIHDLVFEHMKSPSNATAIDGVIDLLQQ